MYFLTNLFLYPGAWIRQVNIYTVIMTKEESSKIMKFMAPCAWVLALGLGHTVKIHYSMTLRLGVHVLGYGHISVSLIVKMHFFLKNLLLYYWA